MTVRLHADSVRDISRHCACDWDITTDPSTRRVTGWLVTGPVEHCPERGHSAASKAASKAQASNAHGRAAA